MKALKILPSTLRCRTQLLFLFIPFFSFSGLKNHAARPLSTTFFPAVKGGEDTKLSFVEVPLGAPLSLSSIPLPHSFSVGCREEEEGEEGRSLFFQVTHAT